MARSTQSKAEERLQEYATESKATFHFLAAF